jgi:hypothetical protein
MATAEDHKLQAEHNRRFLETIDREGFPDWAATVIFYTALHLVQMLFRTKGDVGGSHYRRNATLRRQYLSVWREYQPLYTFSRLSRYQCMEMKSEYVPYLERRLDRVERAIERLL